MKLTVFLIALLLLAACSATNKLPTGQPPTDCTQQQQSEPIEGGIGGTGVITLENCPQSTQIQ